MALNCEPGALMELAKCFQCLPDPDAAGIYLLCSWANGGADPSDQGFLLQSEGSGGGFILLSDGGRIIIQQ